MQREEAIDPLNIPSLLERALHKTMNYYRRYPGDYRRDTADLSLSEHGAYCLLLDHCYASECSSLPSEISFLFRICSAITPEEQAAVRLIADRFFPINGTGQRHNKRVDRQLPKDMETVAASKQRTATARKARWGNNSVTDSVTDSVTESVTESVTDYSTDYTPDLTPNTRSLDPPLALRSPDPSPKRFPLKGVSGKPDPSAPCFDLFWKVYPRHEGRKVALGVWNRKRLNERAEMIINDVTDRMQRHGQWLDGFIPHAAKYLTGERWQDDINPSRSGRNGQIDGSRVAKAAQKLFSDREKVIDGKCEVIEK